MSTRMLKYLFSSHTETCLSVRWSSLWRLCTQAVDFFFLIPDRRLRTFRPVWTDLSTVLTFSSVPSPDWVSSLWHHSTGSPPTDQTSRWTASFYLNRCRKTFYSGGTFSWWKRISAVLFHSIQTIFLRWDIKTVNMYIYIYIYVTVRMIAY